MNIWKNQIKDVDKRLREGQTIEEIGVVYGVSKARIYQVMKKYGIESVCRSTKSYLDGKDVKYFWTADILRRKGFNKIVIEEMLEEFEMPDYCPILGIKLQYHGNGIAGWSGRQEDSPSIDQIRPSEGYTKDNIAIISWRANRIKNDGTAIEHKKISDWILTQKNL